jgi:hypothetical protein
VSCQHPNTTLSTPAQTHRTRDTRTHAPHQNLVSALANIAAALPDLLEDIQVQLLDLMALILSGE